MEGKGPGGERGEADVSVNLQTHSNQAFQETRVDMTALKRHTLDSFCFRQSRYCQGST